MGQQLELWILRPIDLEHPIWGKYDDIAMGFVVCAESERDARVMAHINGGRESEDGRDAWLQRDLSTCERLTVPDERGVVIRDFAQMG